MYIVLFTFKPKDERLKSRKNKFDEKNGKLNSCAYICSQSVSHKQILYETGYFPGNCRPDKAGNNYFNCGTGNDSKCYCRKLQHHPAIHFQTSPDSHGVQSC